MKSVRLLAAALAITFCMQATAALPPPGYPLRVRGGRLYLRMDGTNVPSQVKLIAGILAGNRSGRCGAAPRSGSMAGSWDATGKPPAGV